MSLTTIAAIATIAAAAAGTAQATGLIGGKKAAQPPAAVMPAQGATTARNDTASQIVMGADNVKNQRVGGTTNGGTQKQSTSTVDILGGLGAGGINI